MVIKGYNKVKGGYYMVNAKKVELISELRQLRDKKGITYQQIVDATESIGYPVSLSTVKKVFNDNYTHDHDYNNVLKPIADVLQSPGEEDDLELKVLQTRLQIKEEIIHQLEERLVNKDHKYKEREEFLKMQIEFYTEQIRFKDDQIKRYQGNIDRKDAMIRKLLIENNEET